MIETKTLTDFVVRKQITVNQFYLCHMLYLRDFVNLEKYILTTYKNDRGAIRDLAFKKSEVDDLIARGYLVKTGTSDAIQSYEVTEKFSGEYYIDEEEAGEQLWEAFPKTLTIDGVIQSTRTCDKEEVLETYYRRIKGSRKRHQYILQMTNRYTDLVRSGEMNGMGIEKYIKGENWDVVGEALGNTYEGSTSI